MPRKIQVLLFFKTFWTLGKKNTSDMQLVESTDVEFMDKEGQGGLTIYYNYTTLNLKDMKTK